MLQIDCGALGLREVYLLMTRIVAPRPIAFVSTLDPEGQGNLAPFSYFALGGANPPSMVFCPMLNREGNKKDTLLNIEATREYVISVVTLEMAERVSQASYPYPHGVDEFDAVGFTRAKSVLVAPPRVAESPISLEMRLHTIVRHGAGALASNYVIGEMVYIHFSEEILTDGLPDNRKLKHLARLGEDFYLPVLTEQLLTIPRPTKP
jgi:flavin reductase (DIM6/NTAB) family NADH-FMN oxidoreductase RutF